MNSKTIRLNEVYEQPVIQGEGMDVGKPCFFIRTQGCPVRCEGCDSHFTWDGSEEGILTDLDGLVLSMTQKLKAYPGTGIVVSGGEPLVLYRNPLWKQALRALGGQARWLSLETSGFIGPQETTNPGELRDYLQLFNVVHCSPKVTPCFRGPKWTDEQLDVNLHWILESLPLTTFEPVRLAFKYVVRDDVDVKAAIAHAQKHNLRGRGHPLYLMPYGITEPEVAEGCKRCVEWCAKYDFTLSPRLHVLLYGNKRRT